MDTKPHIVIIGAGFGGLAAAKEFCTKDMDVTLIDKQNHHLFQPLLYQVAAAALSPSDIAVPVRQLFKNDKHIRTVMAEVRAINSQSQTVTTSVGEVSYDYLVIATGARDNYFGNDQWEQYCHSLKTLHDATTLRSHILRAFEQAENAKSPSDQKRHTTFILVGGGPTGVEMAGSLAELAQLVLAEEFRHADVSKADIILLEGSNKILGGFPDDLSQAALLSLKEKGVDVRLNTRVEDIDADGVTANDTAIDASCVIWCAGVKASPIAKWLDCEISTERDGRVHVSDCLSLPQQDKIYIIGDAAFAFNKDGKSYPGVAPVAKQQGKFVAQHIVSRIKSKSIKPFRYKDFGSMATIGRYSAIADFNGLHIKGWLGWFLWGWIHIFFLIGFRNRLRVYASWTYEYFTFKRGSRLILSEAEDE